MNIIKNALVALLIAFVGAMPSFADESNRASIDFTINLPSYTCITPVTSPILTAFITDKTGNLQEPLVSRFKVISNSGEPTQLYLNANVVTQAGYEQAMFEQGGMVYIAFARVSSLPSSSALNNCKYGAGPDSSPGVVAYPITSIQGGEHKYVPSKHKYEVVVPSGESYVTVNVGSNVNRMSFGSNDPRGYYQAILSLTEADI